MVNDTNLRGRLASVGLAQARPNKVSYKWSIIIGLCYLSSSGAKSGFGEV